MIICSTEAQSLFSWAKTAIDVGLAVNDAMKDKSSKNQSNLNDNLHLAASGAVIANNSLQAYSTYKQLNKKDVNNSSNLLSYELGKIEGKIHELDQKEQRNHNKIQKLDQEIKQASNSIFACCKRKQINEATDELIGEINKLENDVSHLKEQNYETKQQLQEQEERIKKLESRSRCEIF